MIKIKISTSHPEWPWLRQLPDERDESDGCQFIIDKGVDECDYWIVYEGLIAEEKTVCPHENVILFTAESPSNKIYDDKFINQFAKVITCQRNIKHPNVTYSQQSLPWHVGREQKGHKNISFSKNYDELKVIKDSFKKTKLISIISSNYKLTSGHRKRLSFANSLKDYFGDKVDFFGRGINEINDKWDAIAPYKYHVVIENSFYDDYWTEKLADSFLGGALPIYYGCPNLEKYFSKNSFIRIDINKPKEAIEIIETCFEENYYEKHHSEIDIARNLILDEYNLFSVIKDLVQLDNNMGAVKNKKQIILFPEKNEKRIIIRVFNKIKRMFYEKFKGSNKIKYFGIKYLLFI
jgi:hypothetical protein